MRIHQDPHIGHLGQPPTDRVGQRQFAFLGQRHRRRHRDRFGHRGNSEKGVASHREAGLDVGKTDLIDLQHIPAMPYTRDGTGDQAGVGGRSYRVPIVREIHLREFTQATRVGTAAWTAARLVIRCARSLDIL